MSEERFNPKDNPIPEHLREVMNNVARLIDGAIHEATRRYDKRVGFVLFTFDFGAGGNLSYISNAEREDVLDTLEEFLRRNGRLQHG